MPKLRLPDMLIFMRPTPDAATCMYYTGIDSFSKQEGYVAPKSKPQRALLQFFKPDNYFEAISLSVVVGSQGGGVE
jgi:hypothetical protein